MKEGDFYFNPILEVYFEIKLISLEMNEIFVCVWTSDWKGSWYEDFNFLRFCEDVKQGQLNLTDRY